MTWDEILEAVGPIKDCPHHPKHHASSACALNAPPMSKERLRELGYTEEWIAKLHGETTE